MCINTHESLETNAGAYIHVIVFIFDREKTKEEWPFQCIHENKPFICSTAYRSSCISFLLLSELKIAMKSDEDLKDSHLLNRVKFGTPPFFISKNWTNTNNGIVGPLDLRTLDPINSPVTRKKQDRRKQVYANLR